MDPDATRRAALSRARQIANAAEQDAGPAAPLHGITVGSVLDYPELRMFVAVTGITAGCIYALGVRQEQPWTALKELRMPPSLVRFRLERHWLRLVPDRRR